MSERAFPSSPSSNAPRIPDLMGRLMTRLGLGKNLRHLPVPVYDDAYFTEKRRARIDATPAGPGLKSYALDSSLFWRHDMSQLDTGALQFYDTFKQLVDRQNKIHPPQEPNPNQEENPFVAMMFSSQAQCHVTPELGEWLQANNRQNGFFTPEMVTEAVAGNPDISVHTEINNRLRFWHFSDADGGSFSLSRTTDGSEPTGPTNPYLGVLYRVEYDFATNEIISIPHLNTGSSLRTSSSLATALQRSLGLTTIHLPQRVEFRGAGGRPVPYFTGPETSSLESIVASPYFIADLPDPKP